MPNKLLRFMDIAKTGAWIAFSCLSFLIIIFPFVGIALALEAMFNPGPFNAYIGLALVCVIYLALFFLIKFCIAIYPWWHSCKRITKTLIAVISLTIAVVVTTVSIIVPQKDNYIKVTKHFEANWKLTLPDDVKLKYNKSRSFGFVGGHDELAYAVFELKNNSLDAELMKLVPNSIRNLTSWNQMKIDWIKDKFPELSERTYTKLYFEQLLNDFPMQIPKRFIPDWNNAEIHWGLLGAYVANYNHIETDACLFVVFTPSTKRLVFYEYLVADH